MSFSTAITVTVIVASVFVEGALPVFHLERHDCAGQVVETVGCRRDQHPVHDDRRPAPAISQAVTATGNASSNTVIGVPSGVLTLSAP